MSKIAFLGLGAMGSRMAAHLVAAGHDMTVWNRNVARTLSLRNAGAAVADSPRAAVLGADFVIAMVRDDGASRLIWLDESAGALQAIKPGAVAIECSTLSLEWVRKLAAQCAERGCAFLDAPVVGSRPQAESRGLIFLAGGEVAALERAEPLLLAMGNAVHHAGSNGAGAALKLAVNGLFGIQVAAFAELIELLRRQGVDPAKATEIIAATPVCSQAAKGAAASMLLDAFAPMFPVEIVEKDLGYVQAAAGAFGQAPMTAAARAVFARALGRGLGEDNLTGIVRLYRKNSTKGAGEGLQ